MDVFLLKLMPHGFLCEDIFKNAWKDSVFKIVFNIINRRDISGDFRENYGIKCIK